MKDCIEEAAVRLIYELEHYLNVLDTIVEVALLPGPLGAAAGSDQTSRGGVR